MEKKVQTSFSKGELSDLIGARPDLAAYFNGASLLENFLVLPEGGVTRDNTGLAVVGRCKLDATRAILGDFVFNVSQAYILEIGNGYTTVLTNDSAPIMELDTPWQDFDLPDLQWRQSADILYVVHPNYQPRQISRLSDTDWTVSLFEFNPMPSHVPETNIGYDTITLTPGATTGIGITFTASENTFLDGDVGRHIIFGQARGIITTVTDQAHVIVRIISPFPNTDPIPAGEWLLTGSPATTLNPDSRGPVGSLVNMASNVNAFRPEDILKFIKIWGGVVQIVTVTDPSNIIGLIQTEMTDWDTSEDPDAALAGTWTLEIPSFSDALGWPSAIEFHEGRLVLAFTNEFPTTRWLSAVDDYHNFGAGAAADSAIEYTVASRRVNRGQWAISLGALFTGDAETELAAKGPGVDTPLGGDVLPFHEDVSSYGSIHHQPIVADKSVFFINRFRNKVYELSYIFDNNNDGFNSKNRTVLARQIGEYKFAHHRAVYAQEPNSVIYWILDNGQLGCLTFNKGEEITAWTRIVTDGAFESVVVIPGENSHIVEVIVNRTIQGVTRRFRERFFNIHTHSAIVQTVSVGESTVFGLEHLAGQTVDVLVNNDFIGEFIVSDAGAVTLDAALDATASVEVGLHYNSTLRTMRVAAPNAVTEGHKRSWVQVAVRVKNTIGGKVNGEPLKPVTLHDESVRPYTGLVFSNPTGADYDGYLTVTQDQPYPMTVLGIAGTVNFTDKIG